MEWMRRLARIVKRWREERVLREQLRLIGERPNDHLRRDAGLDRPADRILPLRQRLEPRHPWL